MGPCTWLMTSSAHLCLGRGSPDPAPRWLEALGCNWICVDPGMTWKDKMFFVLEGHVV